MQPSLQMGTHAQLHPAGMTTCSPLPWYLPLFFLLLFLPWIQGTSEDSSQLSCFYNSKANISCTWKLEPTLRVEQCSLNGTSKQRTGELSCEFLQVEPALWTCDLILGEINSQSLTVVDVLDVKVSCLIEGKMKEKKEEFRPFDKIRLMALSDLRLIQQEEYAYNLSWAVPLCSHYLENYLVFEARYKAQGSSWEKATVLRINQNQRWVYIEKLSPGTTYEFQVRGKPEKNGCSAFWSPWSQTLVFQTKPQVSTFKWPFHLIMGLCGVVSIFLTCLMVPMWNAQKWLKKVLFQIPDPSKFFSSLSTEHGGDFQKWLSSPFPTTSFTTSILAPEISPLEVLQKEDPNLGLLLSKELVPAYRSPETSSHSLSSCFTNQGYFFFHLPDALEVESCQIYFTYSPFSEEEEENKEEGEQGPLAPQPPLGGPEDDSYCTFPPGDDMILFSPRLFQGPGNNLTPQSISLSEKESKKETSTPEKETATTPSSDSSFSRSQNSLDSRFESTQDGSLSLGPGEGPACLFPWAVPPTPDQTHAVSSTYPVLNTGAYLSLGELQNQYHTHSA